MRVCALGVAVLLFCAAAAAASTSTNFVVPTTTLAIQTGNNTSTANGFTSQTNGNAGAGNVSKVNIHSLLYSGAATKVYAHLLLWFGGSKHMNVGYSSTDPTQIHKQIMDMISRGVDGVVIDWYGPGTTIDYATQLVMTEVEKHRGFTFAIMVDQGAIEWDSCKGCTPTQALTADLQYVEKTYFPSKAYLTFQGEPAVASFGIDDSYTIDWNAVNSALATKPLYLFQNSQGFTHVLSGGGYSWVMPTTTDYGMRYLTSFYETGISLPTEQTVGVTYKGFNDTLASWGSNRIMGQQCGRTWLQTFNKINNLYTASKQLPFMQLVTWNDYEEGTEIESGISNCLTISAQVSGNALTWSIAGSGSTVDHYVAYISADGKNLMALTNSASGTNSLNLCSFGVPNGNYVLYVQAVGKPTLTNQLSAGVQYTSTCGGPGIANLNFTATPSIVTLSSGGSGNVTIAATPQSGSFNGVLALACAGLPSSLMCSFAPAAIVPSNITARSILTISTVSVAGDRNERRIGTMLAISLSSVGMVGFTLVGGIPRKRLFQVTGLWILLLLALGGTSCGGSSNAIPSTLASPASYAVTVSGSATGAQVSTSITVTVQ